MTLMIIMLMMLGLKGSAIFMGNAKKKSQIVKIHFANDSRDDKNHLQPSNIRKKSREATLSRR